MSYQNVEFRISDKQHNPQISLSYQKDLLLLFSDGETKINSYSKHDNIILNKFKSNFQVDDNIENLKGFIEGLKKKYQGSNICLFFLLYFLS